MMTTSKKGLFVTFWLTVSAIATAVSLPAEEASTESTTFTSLRGGHGGEDNSGGETITRLLPGTPVVYNHGNKHKYPAAVFPAPVRPVPIVNVKPPKPIPIPIPNPPIVKPPIVNPLPPPVKPIKPIYDYKCDCPYILEPVICYGEEYPNLCTAECDGYYPKDCMMPPKPLPPPPPKCDCPYILDPVVCYGEEYPNLCTARCDGYYEKDCTYPKPLPPKCDCPYNLEPVVCHGEEYPNMCTAECDGYYPKDCMMPPKPKPTPKCDCPYILDPVFCGKHPYEEEFPNLCEATCVGYFEKDCVPAGSGAIACPTIHEPVVCTGGKYKSEEFANMCIAESNGYNVKDCHPVGGKKPIPGGDIDEYGCRFSAGYVWCPTLRTCIRPFEDGICPPAVGPNPKPPKPGPIVPLEPCACPAIYEPVYCGEYGEEYSNLCVAQCEGGYYDYQCTPDQKYPDKYPDSSDLCFLPIDTGPCYASMEKWAYDSKSGSCKKFFYGGCQGNGNNFESKKECESYCYW